MEGLGRFLAQPLPMLSAYDGSGYLNGLYYQGSGAVYVPFFGVVTVFEREREYYPPGGGVGWLVSRDLTDILRYMLFVKEVRFTYTIKNNLGKDVDLLQVMRADPAIRDARSAWFFRAPSLMSYPDATAEGHSMSPLWKKGGHLIGDDGKEGWYDSMVKVIHFKGDPPGVYQFAILNGWKCAGTNWRDGQITYFD